MQGSGSGSRFELTNRDAVAWLADLPSESVDLVITDPPYESLEKHRAIGTTTRLKHSKASSNDWFSIFPNDRFPELFREVYRVLADDSHFYLYCDQETMFVAKPLAEQAGFKFWKPLIWDKCLGPDTLVWTARGVVPIKDVVVGDRVASPEGGTTRVRGTRRTKAPSVRLALSDGTEIVASRDHRFLRADGSLAEAGALEVGSELCTRSVRERTRTTLDLTQLIPEEEAILFPRELVLDYELGKVIGLYAAEGSRAQCGVSFALHAHEKHLHAHVARFARRLGIRAHLRVEDNCANVDVHFKIMAQLVAHFVGGDSARTKWLEASVYAAPSEFRRGVLDGLLEGDGHWSHEEQRETFTSASADLATFVHRELAALGRAPVMSRIENDGAGAWRVRHDPANPAAALAVTAIEELGIEELVDISVDAADELFLLANGGVTHNCRIGMGYHYRARYECILFFEKGKRKLDDLGVADIIPHPRVMNGYPAEKPPEVSQILITQSSSSGQLVIDPFMGSGSVGVAAARNGRSFLGNDLCKEAVDIARARLLEAGATEGGVRDGTTLRPGQLGLSV